MQPKPGTTNVMAILRKTIDLYGLTYNASFYTFPTFCNPPLNWHFGSDSTGQRTQEKAFRAVKSFDIISTNVTYKCYALDFHLCKFHLNFTLRKKIPGRSIVLGCLL